MWRLVLAVILAVAVSDLLKFLSGPRRPFQSGGMPSTHAALMAALTLSVWFLEGFSVLFVVTALIGLLIVHDAMGFRWEVARHSEALNAMVRREEYRRVGHTPLEVVAGILVGGGAALALFLV